MTATGDCRVILGGDNGTRLGETVQSLAVPNGEQCDLVSRPSWLLSLKGTT
jgi:hypothetical protein